MRTIRIKLLSVFTVLALTVAIVAPVALMGPAKAAGFSAMAISPTEVAASAPVDVTITFTGGTYVNNDTVTVNWDSNYDDLTDLANADIALTNADADFTSAACVLTAASDYAICTITASGNVTGEFTLTVGDGDSYIGAPATAASYPWIVTTSQSDFGVALQYVEDDNDVLVTGNIGPTLSFNIRNLTDTSDTNTCALGTVATTSAAPDADVTDDGVGECGYSLAIGTSSTSGFQAQIASDDKLNTVTTGTDDIVDITEDAAWAAGTEAYGLAYIGAAQTGRNSGTGAYDQTITKDGNFSDDSTPVPQAAANFVSYTDGIQYVAGTDATDVTTVMHGLTVGAGTPAGYYDQLVTYTVTAGF